MSGRVIIGAVIVAIVAALIFGAIAWTAMGS